MRCLNFQANIPGTLELTLPFGGISGEVQAQQARSSLAIGNYAIRFSLQQLLILQRSDEIHNLQFKAI